MYLVVLLSNQIIDNYLKAEKLRLRHRSIQSKILWRRHKRVKQSAAFSAHLLLTSCFSSAQIKTQIFDWISSSSFCSNVNNVNKTTVIIFFR